MLISKTQPHPGNIISCGLSVSQCLLCLYLFNSKSGKLEHNGYDEYNAFFKNTTINPPIVLTMVLY